MTPAVRSKAPTTELGAAFTRLLECGPDWINEAERSEASYDRLLGMFGIEERPHRSVQWVPSERVTPARWRAVLAPYRAQLADARARDGECDGAHAVKLVVAIARELHLKRWLQREQYGQRKGSRQPVRAVRERRSLVERLIHETITRYAPEMLERYMAETGGREPATADDREAVSHLLLFRCRPLLATLLAERADLIIEEIGLSGYYVTPPGSGHRPQKRLQNHVFLVFDEIGFTAREISTGLATWWPRPPLTYTLVKQRLKNRVSLVP